MLLRVYVPLFRSPPHIFFFFFNDTATTEIYTLSLHDALPISRRWKRRHAEHPSLPSAAGERWKRYQQGIKERERSEEHTSELQSQSNLVCRLLLEKKKNTYGKPETLVVRIRVLGGRGSLLVAG